jgi:hypothetical protein
MSSDRLPFLDLIVRHVLRVLVKKKTSRKETKSDNGSYGHYLLSVKHAAAGVKNTNAQLPGSNDSRLT